MKTLILAIIFLMRLYFAYYIVMISTIFICKFKSRLYALLMLIASPVMCFGIDIINHYRQEKDDVWLPIDVNPDLL